MKRKFYMGTLVLFSCSTLLFAGKEATCEEKHKACAESCLNIQSQCRARGHNPDECTNRYKGGMAECDKAKKDCDSKAAPTKTTTTTTTKTKATTTKTTAPTPAPKKN